MTTTKNLFLFLLTLLLSTFTWQMPERFPAEKHVEVKPKPEQRSWADEHLVPAFLRIQEGYPVESIREAFADVVLAHERTLVLSISVTPNAASENVICATDMSEDGLPRITLYYDNMYNAWQHSSPEYFEDTIVSCILHEAVHATEQETFFEAGPVSHSKRIAEEADAWCKMASRVFDPMRTAGRPARTDVLSIVSLALFDKVGDDCTHPVWIEIGTLASPKNPEVEYAP